MINKDEYDSYDGYVDALAEEITTLQSELAAAKQSRDREIMAYDRLNDAFLYLNLDLAAAREELARLVGLIKEYEFDAIPTGVRLWIERHESAHKGEEG